MGRFLSWCRAARGVGGFARRGFDERDAARTWCSINTLWLCVLGIVNWLSVVCGQLTPKSHMISGTPSTISINMSMPHPRAGRSRQQEEP